MRGSMVDRYVDLIKHDSTYLKKWIQLYGIEAILLTPNAETQKAIKVFNADSTTLGVNSTNYDSSPIFIYLDNETFGRIENTEDINPTVYSPERDLCTGDVVAYRRFKKLYHFSVSEILSFHDFIYMPRLELLEVIDEDS